MIENIDKSIDENAIEPADLQDDIALQKGNVMNQPTPAFNHMAVNDGTNTHLRRLMSSNYIE